MHAKRNRALLFLGLLVFALLFLFGHVFPVIAALRHKEEGVWRPFREFPYSILEADGGALRI